MGKMALSLPLISQTVGIWDMTHKGTMDLRVMFTIPDLVDFHSEGAEILKVENHKREALL